MKIIHLSDLHLLRPGDLVYEVDPAERLARCIADINAHHADAQLCVTTGDLAHHGEEVGYGLLRELLGELSVPWQLLIGNHDDRTAFRRVFPEVAVDDYGFVQEAKTIEDCVLLFLDTAGWRRPLAGTS
jgi:3',5'-cyclic-AMP phosphodiesterase